MTQPGIDLDALVQAARDTPPTAPSGVAERGWSRLRGELGAVVIVPQIDVPPGVIESAALGKSAMATAAGWGWIGKAIASAVVTVTVGGVGIATMGPQRSNDAVAPAPAHVEQAPVVTEAVASAPTPIVAAPPTTIELPSVEAPVDTPTIDTTAVADTPAPTKPARRPTRAGVDDEAPLVAAALEALAQGDPKRALVSLASHRKRFPNGVMTEDREALRIAAMCRVDPHADIATLRADFLRRWPSSPHASRVRGACSPDAG